MERNSTVVLFAAVLLSWSCGSVHTKTVSQAKPLALPAPHPELSREPEVGEETDGGDGSNEARRSVPEDSPSEAAEFFRKMRVFGDEPLPVERYQAARTHAESMRHYSIAERRIVDAPRKNALAAPAAALGGWSSLGPGNIGGRTRSVLINPKNPSIIYAGSVAGGVWKTVDAGLNWTPISDLTPTTAITTMAFDPTDATYSTIYAGSGESYPGDGARGTGILKTTDAGATWTLLPATNNFNFWYVNKMVAAPSGNLYAATTTGVWSSVDEGATWKQSLVQTKCDEIVARTDLTTDYLFTTCQAATTGVQHAIYRNTDAAGTGTWTSVHSPSNMARTSLAIAPSQQTTVYAMAWNTNPQPTTMTGLAGVFRSTQSGDAGSWTTQTSNADPVRLNTVLLSNPGSALADVCNANATASLGGQGWYDNVLAVDPVDPNRVWAGGVDTFRSDDGGANWGIASYWERSGSEFAHADNHAIVFHPAYDGVTNQTMYLGNDGGVFRTDNARAAVATAPNAVCSPNKGAVTWSSLNHFYTATQFYFGLPYPGGAAFMGGAQDNGTSRGQIQSGVNGWLKVYGGDGGWVAVDTIDPNNLLWEYTNLATYRSADGGLTYTDATHGITEASANFLFLKRIAMDPSTTKRFYVGGSTLWKTEDGAKNWSAVSASISSKTTSDSIVAITVAPSDPNTVFFGTSRGFVYSNTNTQAANVNTVWSSSQPRSTGTVSAIAIDPTNTSIVYAVYSTFRSRTTDNHVYKSTDGGVTWTGIDGTGTTGIPDIPVSAILIDPLSPMTVYLGTDLGVYVSLDGGASWSRDTNAFANTVVTSLTLDRTGGATNLYAFTYGRGAWKVTLSGSPTACTYTLDNKTGTLPAGGGNAPIDITTAAGCLWAALPGQSFLTVQSPAGGNGPGLVNYTAGLNLSTSPRTDTFSVQGQTVAVTQAGAGVARGNDEIATAITPPSLPYGTLTYPPFTDNSTDPVHSCTGSADHNSSWWLITASGNGAIEVEENGYGVISGYATTPGAAGAPPVIGKELACFDGTAIFVGKTSFEVTAGSTYLIEETLRTADTRFSRGVAIRMLPPIRVSIAPNRPLVAAGQSVQLSAAVTATANTAVRWSITPPIGTISPTGLYTAPLKPAVSQVTITASSMQDPTEFATVVVAISGGMVSPVDVSAAGVVNAANYTAGAVAPGEIITVFGAGFGPSQLTGLSVNTAGRVSSAIESLQVTFDGVPAPLIYAVTGQLSAVVPYEVAGKDSTVMLVTDSGNYSQAVTLSVAPAAPALFTLNQAGTGQLAMINEDGTINGPGHPAPKGSIVTVYGTGEGVTVPAAATGQVNSKVFPKPILPASATMGGQPAALAYLGAGPGFVAGVLQGNITVPLNAPSGNAVPVILTIGGVSSSSAATMAIR
jgi:uncharacterized protein (TIGR03437 family)